MKRACIGLMFGLLVAACGGGQKTPPAGGGGTAEPGPAPKRVAWENMTKEQKAALMKDEVLPKAQEMFAAYDATRFAKVDCVTCHGDGVADESFLMPNPKLPHLPTTSDGFKQLAQDKPAAMQFMAGQVKPTMAKILGLPEFNPEHPEAGGFGCAECHVLGE